MTRFKWTETPPLTIDAGRAFGKVCINGTRIPAESVAWCAWAESVDDAAEDYEVSREEVLLACWWFVFEGHLNQVRGSRDRKKQWTLWAEEALYILGGHRKVRLCDPDDYTGNGLTD